VIVGPPQRLTETLKAKFDVSRESWLRLEAYVDLLVAWQPKINLVAPSTMNDVWTRHVADSLQLLRLIPPSALVVDLGSGAGFPGLVIALASDARVRLVESNGKKAAFLRAVIQHTGVSAQVENTRIEQAAAQLAQLKPQIVTARALASLHSLLALSAPLFAVGATGLFHKGENLDAELTEAAKYWKLQVFRHESLIDSKSTILDVKEAIRVA
jgi:16S rRNA (guanine527-N7)-methyltransferase